MSPARDNDEQIDVWPAGRVVRIGHVALSASWIVSVNPDRQRCCCKIWNIPLEYLLFVIIGLAGSLVSAVFGFGTALLVIALGSHVIPVKEAIALGTVLFAASSITKSLLFRRQTDWKVVGVITLGCLPFAALGAFALTYVPADLVKKLLGIMLLVYLGLTLTNWLPSIRIGWAGLLGGSALYGFVSGLLGTGNLVKVILFREMNITKEAFVGAMAATAVLSNIVKLSTYTATGLLTVEMAWPAAALVLAGVLSSAVGRSILGRMSNTQFQGGVQVLLGIAALALLF